MTAYLISIATYVGFFMILALALNLQWGMSGMVNFGVAGFYALGGYTSGVLTVTYGWSFGAGVAAAAVVGIVFGLGVAALSVRLSSHYLAIVTLGFAEIVRLVALNETWLTRGPKGFPIDVRPLSGWFDPKTYPLFYLCLVLSFVLITFLVIEAIARSPYGRVLRAIREDDVVVAGLGKNVFAFRLQAFAVGSMFMSIAGALYAHYIQNISPDHFTPMLAIFIWMAVIVGGAGNNRGLLVGAGVVMALLEGTRFLGNVVSSFDAESLASIRIILIGSILILVLRFRREGILPERPFRSASLVARNKESSS
jgi:branched-chain amino acid transport system permease protein